MDYYGPRSPRDLFGPVPWLHVWCCLLTIALLTCSVHGVVYLSPTGTISILSQPADCSQMCSDINNPCGPESVGGPLEVNITVGSNCKIMLKAGQWDTTVDINPAVNGVVVSAYDLDVDGNTAAHNLTLVVTTPGSISATIQNMKFVDSYLDLLGGTLNPRFQNVSFVWTDIASASELPKISINADGVLAFTDCHFEASPLIGVDPTTFNQTDLVSISNSTTSASFVIQLSNSVINMSTFLFSSYSSIAPFQTQLAVTDSIIHTRSLMGNTRWITFTRTTLLGLEAGFPSRNAISNLCGDVQFHSTTILGTSSSPIRIFAVSATFNTLEILDSNFTHVVFRDDVLSVATQWNVQRSTFLNCYLTARLSLANYPTYPMYGQFHSNQFTNSTIFVNNKIFYRFYPIFTFTGNQFNGPFPTYDNELIIAGGFNTTASDLVLSTLLVQRMFGQSTNAYFDGSLEVDRELSGDLTYPTTFIGPTPSRWTLSSIPVSANLELNDHLCMNITNSSIGISTGTHTISLPPFVSVLWNDPNVRVRRGDTYPLISLVKAGSSLPMIRDQEPLWTYSLQLDCNPNCALRLHVDRVRCHPSCNPAGTETECEYDMTCTCKPGWVGTFCGCPLPAPGPSFSCIDGTWTSNSPVNGTTITFAGNVVINGSLNVSETVIFSGLTGQVSVSGCIIIKEGVVIELTPEDIEAIKGGKGKTLISGDENCEDGTDLSTIALTTKSPRACESVTTTNSGTKQSLTVLFNADVSKCKKSSHVVAIVVPCVIGGVIIIAGIAALIGYRIMKKNRK